MVPIRVVDEHEYVCCLPNRVRQRVRLDCSIALNKFDMSVAEKREALELAMSSKLGDLDDLIDIRKYTKGF